MNKSAPISLPQGYEYFWYDEIDSTNLEAFRKRANGHKSNSWICAKLQTGGRGTGGNKWVSKTGNLFASLIMQTSCLSSKLPQISLVAGMAAIEAIEQVVGQQLHMDDLCLKWPNDILLNGRKLCGILVESRTSGQCDMHDVVIGFGINITNNPDIDGLFPATNLLQQGWTCSRHQLFAALVRSMRDWTTIWSDSKGFETVRLAWLRRSCHIGHAITLQIGDNKYEGRFTTLSSGGAMVLEDRDRNEKEFSSGHIIAIDVPGDH